MKALAPRFVLARARAVPGRPSCGGSQSQVEVKGGESDLAQMAGQWEGNYTGTDSGRTGPITLDLGLGRHTADGTVLMGGSTPLKISFIAVEGGTVSGKIEPYTDPSCSCQVETTFEGEQVGNAISGTFVTKVVGTDKEQRGEWSVNRKQ